MIQCPICCLGSTYASCGVDTDKLLVRGFIGFAGHSDPVAFRSFKVKKG